MCRRAERTFPPEPSSAGLARRFVHEVAGSWGLGAVADDLTLPLSEIVTNVVLHARTPLTVSLAVTCESIEVDVKDSDRRLPMVRPVRRDLLEDLDGLLSSGSGAELSDPRHPALHAGPAGSVLAGRGLLIVDGVADEWGVAQLADGKQVWFTVATPGDWPHRAACGCVGSSAPATAAERPVEHLSGPWDQHPPRTSGG